MDVLSVTTPGPGSRWNQLNAFGNNRFYDVVAATGLASIASADNFNKSRNQAFRRHVPSLLGVPIKTTVSNITIPYFKVESLEWVTSLAEMGESLDSLHEIVTNISNPYLNFSNMNFPEGVNPFAYGTDVGRLTMVNTVPWQPAPRENNHSAWVYPNAEIQQSSTWVIVATEFDQNCTNDRSRPNEKFGDLTNIALYSYVPPQGDAGYVAFGRIKYTAGVVDCKDYRVVLNGVVESLSSTAQAQSWTPLPDPLVKTAIAMMPEVLFYTEIGNASSVPTWNNLDGYTRGMLSVAFQASWNELATDFQAQPMSETGYMTPFPILMASVTKWRVMVWYMLNLLLTLSGIIIGLAQSWCRSKTVQDPTLAALLLDTSALIGHDEKGLCDAVSLEGADKAWRLRLVVPDEGKDSYRHPYLEVDGGKRGRRRMSEKGEYSRLSESEK